MNIRAKIYGGAGSSPEGPILPDKKPKGAKADTLDSVVVQREESRKNDSRSEDRHRLLDEMVEIGLADGPQNVQLINVSGGGAMISGEIDLKLWDKLELRLGENGTVECAVRWVRGDRFGLEFAHETRIDCGADQQSAVLREVVRRSFPDLEFDADVEPVEQHPGPEARGDRRHPLVWSGLLHHDYESTPVRLRNISERGALIDCPVQLAVGSEPLLELGENLSMMATVEWMIGDQAGLRFKSPFDLYDLARSRPQIAGSDWEPPSYLATETSSDSHWGRMSLRELREDLEGFIKR